MEKELKVVVREGWGEGRVREFGIITHTHTYLKWITNKVLLCKTQNSCQSHVAASMGGEFGGGWINVNIRLSPFAIHLELSQHC